MASRSNMSSAKGVVVTGKPEGGQRLTMPWTQTHTVEQHAKQPEDEEVVHALQIINKKREAKAQADARETSSQTERSHDDQ